MDALELIPDLVNNYHDEETCRSSSYPNIFGTFGRNTNDAAGCNASGHLAHGAAPEYAFCASHGVLTNPMTAGEFNNLP
jgi:hypothetical protein